MLQDLIQSRTKRLAGAYEIHKFNRDAKEILGRIQVCTYDLRGTETAEHSMVVVFVRIFYQTKDRITWAMITLHVCIPLKDKGVIYMVYAFVLWDKEVAMTIIYNTYSVASYTLYPVRIKIRPLLSYICCRPTGQEGSHPSPGLGKEHCHCAGPAAEARGLRERAQCTGEQGGQTDTWYTQL